MSAEDNEEIPAVTPSAAAEVVLINFLLDISNISNFIGPLHFFADLINKKTVLLLIYFI